MRQNGTKQSLNEKMMFQKSFVQDWGILFKAWTKLFKTLWQYFNDNSYYT